MRFKKAVLLIHGFAGGTYDQEDLANYLQLSRRFDVFSFTLPGHDVKDPDDTKKTKWLNKACEQIEWLIKQGYYQIYVIGHSMGGMIACYLANKYSEVKRLVLLAPAFDVFASEDGEFDLSNALQNVPDILRDLDASFVKNQVFKLPLSALSEFFDLSKECQPLPLKIKVPTLILQGTKDTIVLPKSSKTIFEELAASKKQLYYVRNVNHLLFKNNRCEELCKLVSDFLNKYDFEIKKLERTI